MTNVRKDNNLDDHYWKLIRRIAKNIKSLRESKKLSQEDMFSFGFERRWYQRIESGTYSVSLPTLDRLARAFKVDVSTFFNKQ